MSTRRETAHLPSAGYDEHSLDDFLSNTDAIILVLNPRTMQIEKASRGAVEFYGWPRGELIGKKIGDIELLDEASIRKNFQKVLSSQQRHFFLKHRTADGKIADMEVFVDFLHQEQQPLLCSVMYDTTEKRRSEDRLRKLSLEITRIEERERKQFASYLHDEVGQNLAMMKMKLEAISYSPPAPLSGHEFDQVYDLIDRTIEQTRSMIFDLSPPVLYRFGLSSALRNEGEKICRENGLEFVFTGEEVSSMPDDERILIYRCAQELMRNCVRHARASRMELSLRNEGARIVLRLVDNGIGFDVASLDKNRTYRGFGLFSVRERIRAIGGALTIESRMGEGTYIDLIAPIN